MSGTMHHLLLQQLVGICHSAQSTRLCVQAEDWGHLNCVTLYIKAFTYILTAGVMQIRGEFVVFDNGLIQLVQFSPRSGSGPAFMAHETRTSPAYIAAPHICFWVQDEVDFNHYIAQLEARASSLGLNEVKVNRPVEVRLQTYKVTGEMLTGKSKINQRSINCRIVN